jgi:hypothetical protein
MWWTDGMKRDETSSSLECIVSYCAMALVVTTYWAGYVDWFSDLRSICRHEPRAGHILQNHPKQEVSWLNSTVDGAGDHYQHIGAMKRCLSYKFNKGSTAKDIRGRESKDRATHNKILKSIVCCFDTLLSKIVDNTILTEGSWMKQSLS